MIELFLKVDTIPLGRIINSPFNGIERGCNFFYFPWPVIKLLRCKICTETIIKGYVFK